MSVRRPPLVSALAIAACTLAPILPADAASPALIRDLQVAAGTSIETIAVGETLYFTAGDLGTTGMELFRTTAGGSALVRNVNPGALDARPGELTSLNGTLFFAADSNYGRELWRTDGTSAGTVMVKNIGVSEYEPTNGNSGKVSSDPRDLTVYNGSLFFGASQQVNGGARELWRSDGTDAGTARVGTATAVPSGETVVSGGVMFISTSTALWRSDGTAAGSRLVKQIYSNGSTIVGTPIRYLHDVGGTLYFSGNDVAHGHEPWRSDGTAAGTFMIKDLDPGAFAGTGEGYSSSPFQFVGLGDDVFFSARPSSLTGESRLFRTRGVLGDAAVVRGDLFVNSRLTRFGDELFFNASDGPGGSGGELWATDGTADGTRRVADINAGDGSSTPGVGVVIGDRMYFAADDGLAGRELWVTDGTADGTLRLADFNPGSGSSDPRNLTDVNGVLHFVAFDGVATNLYALPEPATLLAALALAPLCRRRRRRD